MKQFIRKTEFGFQYRKEGNTGFNFFPDDIKLTQEGMKAYFQRGGRNEAEIVFCNKEGKPAKLYTIKLSERVLGNQFAMVDNEKKFLFEADLFVPDAEKLLFLTDHSSREQDLAAIKLESDSDKIKYYLSNIDDATKTLYNQHLNEKMTPDVLKELCVNNAKTYGLPAEVEIISE